MSGVFFLDGTSWGSCMSFEFYGFCRATILVEGAEAIR
jgi:hypothetical protein